ncbi:Signal peptidase I V [bacterium HR23]|nr:Signal peptidase I V [bacterium HR23]
MVAFLSARRVVVRGWSMAPTLLPGDYLLVDTSAYRSHPPRRGEVVLARDPQDPHRLLLKRVAGVPGDYLGQDADGLVHRLEGGVPPPTPLVRTWRMGEGEYFLVGEADAFSQDSRTFGPVPRETILGRAWLVYWPPHRWRRLG